VIEHAATEVFAERGYRSASIDEIATRSGVSAPVVYDHFESKQDLYRRLLERHFAELRAILRRHMLVDDPPERRIPTALDAWFGYVQTHPGAARMLFQDTAGDADVQAIHRKVSSESRAAMLPLLAREPGAAAIARRISTCSGRSSVRCFKASRSGGTSTSTSRATGSSQLP